MKKFLFIPAFIPLLVVSRSPFETLLSLPDDSVKVQSLLDLGYAYEDSDPDSAILIYEAAGVIGKSAGYDLGYGRSLNYRGIVEFERGNYSRSENYYQTSIEVFRRINYQKGIAAAYNNIGNIYLQQGNLDKSTEYHLKGLSIFKETNDTPSLVRNLNNLGTIFYDNKSYSKSLDYYSESLRLSTILGDTTGIVDACSNLANNYERIGDTAMSMLYLEKAMALMRPERDPYGALLVYSAYSISLSRAGRRSEAVRYAEMALALAYRHENPYNICESLALTGEMYLLAKEYRKAEAYLDKALETGRQNNYLESLSKIHHYRAQLMAELKNHEQAYAELRTFNTIQDTLFHRDRQMIIQELEAKYQNAVKESLLTEQDLTIAEQNFRVSRQRSLIFWILVTAAGILITLFLGLAYIHQRRRLLHNRLRILERDKELQNMKYLIEGEEKERSRLAKELHDGVNGSLGAIKLMASSGITSDKTKSSEKWGSISKMIDQLSDEVREISHNLMPDVLTRLGLEEALQGYLRRIRQSQQSPDIDFLCYGDVEHIDTSIKMNIYRVIQELIRNILKHAGATGCIIQINRHEENLSVVIEDNGKGFDIFEHRKKKRSSGIGLQSVYSRIELLGGQIDIQSTLYTGTSVHIDIPLKHEMP